MFVETKTISQNVISLILTIILYYYFFCFSHKNMKIKCPRQQNRAFKTKEKLYGLASFHILSLQFRIWKDMSPYNAKSKFKEVKFTDILFENYQASGFY